MNNFLNKNLIFNLDKSILSYVKTHLKVEEHEFTPM